jgi:hypothetical protein
MNCRPSAVALFAVAGLVPGTQAAIAGTPTHRQATATATILNIASVKADEVVSGQARLRNGQAGRNLTVKHIGVDGHIAAAETAGAQVLIILDLP